MRMEPEEGAMLKLLKMHVKKSSSIESHGMALILEMERVEKIEHLVYGPTRKLKQNISLRPKRKRTGRAMNAKRHKVLRSRNEVVDQWLNLDNELSSDEGENEDAFIDLEDFLEPG